MAMLTFLSGPAAGLSREIRGQLTLGRSRACDVALNDDQVSRQHARIEDRDGGLVLCDLASRNGTRINGQRIASETALLDGDRIQVGASVARLEMRRGPAAEDVAKLASSVEGGIAGAESLREVVTLSAELLAGDSAAGILRTATRFAARCLRAGRVAVFARGSISLPSAELPELELPHALVQTALDAGGLIRSARMICIPLLTSERERLGAICVEGDREPGPAQLWLAAAAGRLGAEALAALRVRAEAAPPTLVGTSPDYRRMLERIAAAATVDEPVTFFGEVGSGRSAAARYLHACSSRAWGPFVAINCAAPGELDAALRSADGGSAGRAGLLRAEGGTLVLRHVETLPRSAGERLARWMLGHPASGAAEPRRFGGRAIAIAREPLEILAARRRVPGELAEALAGVPIEVPPLRERSSDVPTLFHFFAREHSRQLGREPPRLSAEAKRLMMGYAWPGNVAELRLLAETLCLTCAGLEISISRLPAELVHSRGPTSAQTLRTRVRALERAAIAEALSAAGGKKVKAAQILGISRPTLDKKLKELHQG